MPEIMTAGELGIELAEQCSVVAQNIFSDAIRPIYFATDRGLPDHLGSCVLLNIDGNHLLLTAAHVIDTSKDHDTTLYVGGEKSLVKIEGEFWTTYAKDGNRLKDRYDFAVGPVTDEFVRQMGNVRYILRNEIAPDRTNHSGRVYSIIGYPNTKNKSTDRRSFSVTSKRWHFFGTHQENAGLLKKLNITGKEHIFVGYTKHSIDSEGKKVGSVSTHGVSGGGVFDLGNLSNPANYAPNFECTPLLAGLFIEFYEKHHVTVTTKMSCILNALEENNFI